MLLQWPKVAVEVVELDQENAGFRILLVMRRNIADQLQSHGCFSRSLGAKNNGGSRLFGIAKHFAPGGMVRPGDAEFPENRVRLSVLIRKRISEKLMMVEEFLFSHGSSSIVERMENARGNTGAVLCKGRSRYEIRPEKWYD